jgi:hypothetical protein
VSDPTARPSLSPELSTPAWLLGPAELAAINADDALINRLGAGEQPGENDPDPVAAALGAFVAEVEDGGAR